MVSNFNNQMCLSHYLLGHKRRPDLKRKSIKFEANKYASGITNSVAPAVLLTTDDLIVDWWPEIFWFEIMFGLLWLIGCLNSFYWFIEWFTHTLFVLFLFLFLIVSLVAYVIIVVFRIFFFLWVNEWRNERKGN